MKKPMDEVMGDFVRELHISNRAKRVLKNALPHILGTLNIRNELVGYMHCGNKTADEIAFFFAGVTSIKKLRDYPKKTQSSQYSYYQNKMSVKTAEIKKLKSEIWRVYKMFPKS